MKTVENTKAPIQDCSHQAVVAGEFFDCSYPRDHTGPHSWEYPNLYPQPSGKHRRREGGE